MSAALHYENLVVEYHNKSGVKRAVDQVSLTVEQGEIFALLGPNGAGKTSMISATTSLIPY
jgi:ABC-2 type transport system ATP-binding protein